MDDIHETIAAARVIPMIVVEDAEDAPSLGRALADGGLPIAEVTFRTDAAGAAIRAMAKDEGMLVGAGTVLTPAQVDEAVDAGARFIVSPGFSAAVVRRCREVGVPVFPGVATPTEIQAALEAGVETVKFFPAEALGGVATLKALAAPFREVRFLPTGGVGQSNMAAYLGLPSVLAVGGSWLAPASLVTQGRWGEITRFAAEAVAAARQHSGGA